MFRRPVCLLISSYSYMRLHPRDLCPLTLLFSEDKTLHNGALDAGARGHTSGEVGRELGGNVMVLGRCR